MNRFVLSSGAFILTTLIALTVLAATPTTAPVRSAVQARSTYDPFVMSRAAAAQPGTKEFDNYQYRAAVVKWLKDKDKNKVKPPKPRPERSPHKPEREDDDDNGHGNNDDHDDGGNPGQGNGNHGTGNNGNGDHRNDKGTGRH